MSSKVDLCAEGQVCGVHYRLVNVVTKLYFIKGRRWCAPGLNYVSVVINR